MTLEETDRIAPIENYDPIAAFLRKKLKLTPLRFGLLSADLGSGLNG